MGTGKAVCDSCYTGNQVMVASYFPTFDFKKEVVKKSDEVKSPAIFVGVGRAEWKG